VEYDGEADERARHEAMYRIMDGIAAEFPGDVYVVDLAGHTSDLEYSRDARPDGVHWAPEVATEIAADYLGEELLRAALDLEPR
jgi:sugar lactone lactonase YvrE